MKNRGQDYFSHVPPVQRAAWPPSGLLLLLAVAAWAGCGRPAADAPRDARLQVMAGIPPVAGLAEAIGGEHVKVDVLVQPGQDPHTFEASPRQVLALGRAAIFLKIDMPFETVLLEKAKEGNRRLVVVDVARGIVKRPLAEPCREHESAHLAADKQDHRGQPDPHVWLAPALLKSQAREIAEAFCRVDPDHQQDYRRNFDRLLERLDATDCRMRRLLAPHAGRAFYVFHPGFGYFADAYGLKEEAIETAGRSPSPKQLRDLVEAARADGVTTVFVQPQSSPQSAEVVAEAIGGKVATINGLDRDALADIEDIAAKVARSFQGTSAEPSGDQLSSSARP